MMNSLAALASPQTAAREAVACEYRRDNRLTSRVPERDLHLAFTCAVSWHATFASAMSEEVRSRNPHKRGWLIATGVIAALVAACAHLASEVLEQETMAFDTAILRAMRDASGNPIGPAWLAHAIADLSALGSTTIASSIIVIVALFLLLARRRRYALLVSATGIGTAIAILLLKGTVGRARPDIISKLEMAGGYSFPSGHTFTAAAIYPLLAFLLSDLVEERRAKVFLFAVAAFIALVVGFSRVYLGVHYPTDVLAGWGFGLAWAIVCAAVAVRLIR
jgi:undecaprenyl-diphosphatase